MTKIEAQRRIATLRKEINIHRTQYHVYDRSTLSEAALDALKKELVDLELQFPDLITLDSPTQRVGGKPLAKFPNVRHTSRMLSLNDAFGRDDLVAWEERLHRVDPRARWTYFVEPKIDGLAISLVYEKGLLLAAATRGDGSVGEDVTQNIKTIESVPLRLEELPSVCKRGHCEIRGEVYLSKKEFERINAERKKAGLPLYQNPRNTAAGSIRQLDPVFTAQRKLDFLAYALVTASGQTTHAEEHTLLKKMGFRTDPDAQRCKDIAAIMTLYDDVHKKRERMDFQIDGLVILMNENDVFQRFGVVGKAPRGAIALKFPAEQTTTMVTDIQVQVGRTGALTPVAHLRPVQVAGTTVTAATLHNMDEIQRLGVKIGDTVVIEKAGDIIPDIVQVLPNLRTGKEKEFHMPRRCPVCGSPVVKKGGEVAFYCSNKHCFAQHREQLHHFVSKKSFDIDGCGPKIIDQLLENKIIASAADLFALKEEDLLPLERFAEISAKKLIYNIHTATNVTLARLLYGLGIRHVGEQTAVDLANHFGSLEKLQHATQEELEHVHDIGSVVAESIVEYFRDPQHQTFLKDLLQHVRVEKSYAAHSRKFSGKSFLFTGTLVSMTRDDAKELVRANGGDIASSVSKKLNFLVVGEEPGSKFAKARSIGVSVIAEKEFLKMVA